MNRIQVDMFEVQLGAALLLQFRISKKRVVRVLADAGISATKYPVETVRDRLSEAFAYFNGNDRRVDLIIGTHYDEDHLEGLVPIIKDQRFDIGEAWLPPVANDTDPHEADQPVREHHLLAYQFSQAEGDDRLTAYQAQKRLVCDELRELEQRAEGYRPEVPWRGDPRILEMLQSWAPDLERNLEAKSRRSSAVEYFQAHFAHANSVLGIAGHTHADDEVVDVFGGLGLRGWVSDDDTVWQLAWRNSIGTTREERLARLTDRWQSSRDLADSDARSLAYIRRSAAKDAINATSLAKVVAALKARSIPINAHIIKDGSPRRFVWKERNRQFVPGRQLKEEGPELLLLGPSQGLVKKHWDRLPLGNYLSALTFTTTPIQSITPSNQLSYVAKLEFRDQGLLVTGDAGCVDFKPTRGDYHKALLGALSPLHVIQVAHHGGNNAHFYRVLLEAGYGAQKAPSLLLLSHATHDRYRPSKEFGLFIEDARSDSEVLKLLFTSEPSPEKVRDFKDLVHPVVGKSDKVGDIRISFNKARWIVRNHAVRV